MRKKGREKLAKIAERDRLADEAKSGPKPLVITPQIPVGLDPDGNLFIELPNKSGTRHKVILGGPSDSLEFAGQRIYDALQDKKVEIEAERTLQQAIIEKAKKPRAQPDWRLIAQHPEATIIERLPTKAKQLAGNKSEKTLEEMGL